VRVKAMLILVKVEFRQPMFAASWFPMSTGGAGIVALADKKCRVRAKQEDIKETWK